LATETQFAGIDVSVWKSAADRLSQVGVFADEQGDFPAAQSARSLRDQIQEKLQSLGYSGGHICIHVFDTPQEGATYLLFDTTRFADSASAQNAWLDDYRRRWQAKVTERVDDWLERLTSLRQTFEQWIRESGIAGLAIVDRPPVFMNEELMRRFRITPKAMPVYEILRNGKRLMRIQPKGLWVIGANGRVDLITRSASPILVDNSDSLSSQSDWQLYTGRDRRRSVPLTKEAFLDLLQQAAA
jgi:hypothetical protein